MESGALTRVFTVPYPVSIAVAAVIAFMVEPGSNANWNTLAPRSDSGDFPGSFGSTLGASAAKMIRPVSTSITTAVAQSAFSLLTSEAKTCCA
ncbi:unannotated protein [freshwater metagenome]|uniref:Unannotated protein n=1 Tax=freshwater metagenome TaxID=449393 RepID=A0A6J6MH05_9ZZZZ